MLIKFDAYKKHVVGIVPIFCSCSLTFQIL